MRNWRHYEGLEKYNNEEIKIFDNFGDIEANDILTTIKKNNTEIEQKEFLKQNKKYSIQNKILPMSFQKYFMKKFMISYTMIRVKDISKD